MYKMLMANKKLPFQILHKNSNMVSMVFVVSFDLRTGFPISVPTQYTIYLSKIQDWFSSLICTLSVQHSIQRINKKTEFGKKF